MLNNSLHNSRFTRGIYYSPIHAQVPEFTPGKLLHACRNDIDSGVNVAVVSRPALRTTPLSDIKPQFIELMTASATGLARWKPTINGNQSSAVPLALVFELPSNLSPARIGNMPCESGVLNHVLYFQIFDTNHIEVSNQSGGQLVRFVLTLVPDFGVSLGDSESLPLSPLTALLFSAQGALLLAEITEPGVVLLGVFGLLPVAQCGKASQSEVDADYLVGDRKNIYLDGCAERDVILTVWLSLEGDHFRAFDIGQGFGELDFSDLRQPQLASTPFCLAWSLKADGYVIVVLRPEPGVTRFLASFHSSEEIRERLILVVESLSQACCWGSSQPDELIQTLKVGKPLIYVDTGNVLFPSLVSFLSGLQRIIPNPTSAAEPMIQHANLCPTWVCAKLVTFNGRHVRILTYGEHKMTKSPIEQAREFAADLYSDAKASQIIFDLIDYAESLETWIAGQYCPHSAGFEGPDTYPSCGKCLRCKIVKQRRKTGE